MAPRATPATTVSRADRRAAGSGCATPPSPTSGRVRKDNQDSGYAGPHLSSIADGVGGAARGDVASSAAMQPSAASTARARQRPTRPSPAASTRAHDRLAELVEQHPELDGTSTTVTAALFDGTRISVGHVGDSRGYLLRDGALSQLTKDHTFVQSLIDEGRITEEESRIHPHRNLILRAVDGVHETEPDLFDVELAAGDRLLLCSDGCSGALDDDRARRHARRAARSTTPRVELIRASLEAGSTDNVTVVVADVVDRRRADARRDPGEPSARCWSAPPPSSRARRPASTSRRRQPRRGHREQRRRCRRARRGRADAPVDPEELRYAPAAAPTLLWLRRLAVVLVVVLALLVRRQRCGLRLVARSSTTSPSAGQRWRSSGASRPTCRC